MIRPNVLALPSTFSDFPLACLSSTAPRPPIPRRGDDSMLVIDSTQSVTSMKLQVLLQKDKGTAEQSALRIQDRTRCHAAHLQSKESRGNFQTTSQATTSQVGRIGDYHTLAFTFLRQPVFTCTNSSVIGRCTHDKQCHQRSPLQTRQSGPDVPVSAPRGTSQQTGDREDTSVMPPTIPRPSKVIPWDDDVPLIDHSASFSEVVMKLSEYVERTVDAAYSYDQLRTSLAGRSLRPLIVRLSEDCHHPALVAALLAARYRFNQSEDDDLGLKESRGLACELVAWQFLTFLSEKDLIDYLLYELPSLEEASHASGPYVSNADTQRHLTVDEDGHDSLRHDERSPLLQSPRRTTNKNKNDNNNNNNNNNEAAWRPLTHATFRSTLDIQEALGSESSEARDDVTQAMAGMNALEIAAIANAKKFTSQQPVQKIVEDIWNGNVIFWESLSVHAEKHPRRYNKRVADPFTRLRVPKYQKAFQVSFFVAFLVLYYAVLVERNPRQITPIEVLLYLWIAAFAYDEFGEFQDAGMLFYQTDFWSLWDIAIILVGIAFFLTRVIGLLRGSDYIIDVAFDILSIMALFLIPRICSVASMNPYFGSLIPVLKQMTAAFCKFLPVILVLYLGFLTTFTMLARDRLTVKEMSWILVNVFFGSSYLGFDIAVTISPLFGYTLMVIFVALTNILLITALISLVSNSLTEVMAHAREEYLFQYSVYVLESSTSRRLTYFLPPLNLIPLLLLRPLRLLLPSETVRRVRILTLKATHAPLVALIWTYESSRWLSSSRGSERGAGHGSGPGSGPGTARPGIPSRPSPTGSRPLSARQPGLDHDRDDARRSGQKPSSQPGPANGAADSSTTGSPPPPAESAPSLQTVQTVPGDVHAADVELLRMVQELSRQVEELTALVAGQKTA